MDLGNLILRVVTGASVIIFHSWARVVGMVKFLGSGKHWGFIDMLQKVGLPLPGFFAILVVLVEFIGSIFIILGLFTRISAIGLALVLIFAIYFQIVTKASVELSLIYLSIFIFLALAGAGKFSLDSKSGRK
jgi:putative oxidoreductase